MTEQTHPDEKNLSPVPCYDWLTDQTREKVEAFNRKLEEVLKDREAALHAIARCRASVNEGKFTALTLKAVDKARAEIAVADAAELALTIQASNMSDLVRADNLDQIEEAKKAIDLREKDVRAAGAKDGKHPQVIEAEIQTDSKIQEICDTCPPRLDLDSGVAKAANKRAAVLSAKMDKLFT